MTLGKKQKTLISNLFWVSLTISAIIGGFLLGIHKHIRRILELTYRNTVLPDPSQFGLNYSLVSFPSCDGINLRGWWFGKDNRQPVVILIHGIRANRAEPPERVFGLARELLGHNYNVLAFDLRAHGESGGNQISAGYYEKNDLLGAIKFIRGRGITSKIGVLGFSMGAAVSLMAAAECKEISAVVADSSFVDVVSLIKWKFSRWRLVSLLLVPTVVFVIRALYSIDFRKIKPLEAIKLISVPVFIIHGGKDSTIPVSHAYRLRSACHNRWNQLWVVPEASHTDAFTMRTEEYVTKILSFFNKALVTVKA
jgi:pimeloyl-ACP methyl ester carboxylesterase